MLAGAEQPADEPVRRGNDVVQRRLLLLEAGQAAQDRLGVVRHDPPQQIAIAQGDRGKHVMARAALHEEGHDVPARRREHRRPADHVHPVQVPEAVYVRPGVEQHPDRLDRADARRAVERKRVVADVARVGIRAALEQQPQRLGVAHGQVECGGTLRGALPDEAGMAVQKVFQRGQVTRTTRGEKRDEQRSAAPSHLGS